VLLGQTGVEVELVEHLFGALAGFSVQQGLAIEVDGPEIPLLDGGARCFCEALRALCPPATASPLRIQRTETLCFGQSIYRFEPGDGCRVSIEVDFPGAGVGNASWEGSAESFEREIAPAKTFGFAADGTSLAALGLARHIDRRAVVVLEQNGRVAAGFPPLERGADDLARHKLLDLLGDLYLFGGPPVGQLWVRRPGHGPNHEALRTAMRSAIVAESDSRSRSGIC
jgi:UDP-3-O-[3-hydroxymyristoyl] N-acetylglucosamine deacetylase